MARDEHRVLWDGSRVEKLGGLASRVKSRRQMHRRAKAFKALWNCSPVFRKSLGTSGPCGVCPHPSPIESLLGLPKTISSGPLQPDLQPNRKSAELGRGKPPPEIPRSIAEAS
eukprot:8488431-Pyramimonas_sp.AAC.1